MNVVRKVMGHEQTSTTLDIHTHTPYDYERRVIDALSASDAYVLPIHNVDHHEGDRSDLGHIL